MKICIFQTKDILRRRKNLYLYLSIIGVYKTKKEYQLHWQTFRKFKTLIFKIELFLSIPREMFYVLYWLFYLAGRLETQSYSTVR